MTDFFGSPLFQGLAGGASIMGLIWLLVAYLSQRRQVLSFAHTSQRLVKTVPLQDYDFLFSVNCRESRNIVRDLFLLYNGSRRNYAVSDFIESPSIHVGSDGCVLAYSLKSGDGLVPAKLFEEGCSVFLDEFILRSGRGIVVEILHNGKSSCGFSASVREQPSLKSFDPSTKMLPIGIFAIFIVGIPAFIAFLFSLSALISLSGLPGFVLFLAMMPLIFGGMLLVDYGLGSGPIDFRLRA